MKDRLIKESFDTSQDVKTEEEYRKQREEQIERRKQNISYALNWFCMNICVKPKKDVIRERTTTKNGKEITYKVKEAVYPIDYRKLMLAVSNLIHIIRPNNDFLPRKTNLELWFSEEERRIVLYRTLDNEALVQKSKLDDWYIEHLKDDSLFALDVVQKLILAFLIDERFPVNLSDEEQKTAADLLINNHAKLTSFLTESVDNGLSTANSSDILPDESDYKWLEILDAYNNYWKTGRNRKDTQAYLKKVFKVLGPDYLIERLNISETEDLFVLVHGELDGELRRVQAKYPKNFWVNESVDDLQKASTETLKNDADESLSPYNEIAEDIIKLYHIHEEKNSIRRLRNQYVTEEFEDPNYSDEVESIYEKFDKIAPIQDKLNLLSKIYSAALYNGECLMGHISETISESKMKPAKRYIKEMSTFEFFH